MNKNHARMSLLAAALLSAGLLAACGGGGGGSSPMPGGGGGGGNPSPSPSPTASPTSSPTSVPVNTSKLYDATDGAINGTSSQLGANDQGAPSTATIDGVPCDLTADAGAYQPGHIHAFVGVIANGTVYALPKGIGMFKPDTSVSGSTPNYTAGATQCLFNLHTHDQSGTVHVEYPTQTNNAILSFSLGQFLQVWSASSGMAYSTSGGIGPFSGSVRAFTGTAVARPGLDPLVSSYTEFSGDPTTISITSHVAIWLVVGNLPANGLPEVEFGSVQ